MSTNFRIEFEVSQDEWAKARECRHDPDVEPIFELFYGNVVIHAAGESLLGPPYNISVADLACGFARILREGFPNRTAQARFRQGDDSLQIDFAVTFGTVQISSEGRRAEVSQADFLSGARAFVSQFARQAWERIPDVFRWKDLEVLGRFSDTSGPPN